MKTTEKLKKALLFSVLCMTFTSITSITSYAYNDAYDKVYGSNSYEHNGITLSPSSSGGGSRVYYQ